MLSAEVLASIESRALTLFDRSLADISFHNMVSFYSDILTYVLKHGRYPEHTTQYDKRRFGRHGLTFNKRTGESDGAHPHPRIILTPSALAVYKEIKKDGK